MSERTHNPRPALACNCKPPNPAKGPDDVPYCRTCGHLLPPEDQAGNDEATRRLRVLAAFGLKRLQEEIKAAQRDEEAGEWITAKEVGQRYPGTSQRWAYQYQVPLRARKLGNGPKPRLLFNTARIEECLAEWECSEPPQEPAPKPARRRRRPPGKTELLPIGPKRRGKRC